MATATKSPVRGRPPIFGEGSMARRRVIAAIKRTGNVTHARKELKKAKIEVSLPTMFKLAHEEGLKLQVGRPAEVA